MLITPYISHLFLCFLYIFVGLQQSTGSHFHYQRPFIFLRVRGANMLTRSLPARLMKTDTWKQNTKDFLMDGCLKKIKNKI